LKEGRTMQSNPQSAALALPRFEDRTYRAVTVAAILLVVVSVWVF
jgi:hypothetical protein